MTTPLCHPSRNADNGRSVQPRAFIPPMLSPEQFRQFLITDLAKWTTFVKQTGAKLE